MKKRKIVQQFDLYGELIEEFESITDASLKTHTQHTCISACCKGKRKTAGGFVWRYKKNNQKT